jgi:hypothetical protein
MVEAKQSARPASIRPSTAAGSSNVDGVLRVEGLCGLNPRHVEPAARIRYAAR